MKKIKLAWFLLPELTFFGLTSFIACAEETKVVFSGSSSVIANRVNDNLVVTFKDFSLLGTTKAIKDVLESAAVAKFSENLLTEIIPTDDSKFDVQILIPNASDFETGQFRLSLIIYEKNNYRTLFNQVLSFVLNPSIVVTTETTLTFSLQEDDKYWSICPGFVLKNFQSPYNYGFQISSHSKELGNVDLEFELEETKDNGDCSFSILFRSDAEYIEPGKSFNLILYIPNYEKSTIDFRAVAKEDTTFRNDSWDNVIYYANKGLNELKRHYGVNTFVGLIRSIRWNDSIYHVRVIGENHDVLSDHPSNFAALTFEFVELLSNYHGSALEFQWYHDASTKPLNIWFDESTSNQKSSFVRTYLNDPNGDFLPFLPANVRKAIKFVKKPTARHIPNSDESVVEEHDELIWLTSCYELCHDDTGVEFLYDKEGKVYEYYKDCKHYYKPHEMWAKKDLNGEYSTYWLRSPCYYSLHDDDEVISLTADFNMYRRLVIIEGKPTKLGVAPCFCI